MVKELHWKCANYLVKNYDTILLPDFRVSKMVQGKKLGVMTKRLLTMFSFYAFKQKLLFKCEQYNKKLIIVNECYTSCTCGKCGEINKNLKSSETFRCSNCELEIDRDAAGSRNILLKHLRLKETV